MRIKNGLSMNRANRTAASALVLSLLTAGCGSSRVAPPVWNQFHADSAGTGAVYAATKPADGSGVIQEQLSAMSVASPVIAPDGRAYVSICGFAP